MNKSAAVPDVGCNWSITREQREAWRKNTADSPFNRWLDGQVKRQDGSLDLNRLYAIARKWDIEPEPYET